LDWNWQQFATAGEYIIIEGYVIIDPDAYTKVYNDRMLKKYATALIKKQWGNNMKKFGGMQLPGGITMNGQQIYEEAVAEIEKLEQLIRDTFEEPPQFIIG
jgi:gamma-glutamyl-gamma-aminobutyrate hydrolase PuuD